MDAVLNAKVMGALEKELVGRELPVERWGNALLLRGAGGEAVIEAKLLGHRTQQGATSVELLVDFMPRLPDEFRSVRDALVGHGTTDDEALADAVAVWADGVLEPALRAFLAKDAPPDALWTPEGRTEPYRVDLGPMQVAGAARDAVEGWDPDLPFPTLCGALAGRLRHRRACWIKVFVGRMKTEFLGVECRVDNDPWAEGEALLRAFAWPPAEDYFGFKRFIVLRPT